MPAPETNAVQVPFPIEWEEIYSKERKQIFTSRIIRAYMVILILSSIYITVLYLEKPKVFEDLSSFALRVGYILSHFVGLIIAYKSVSVKGIILSVFVSIFLSTAVIEVTLITQPWHQLPKHVLVLVSPIVALMLPVKLKEILPIAIGIPIFHACTAPWQQASDTALEALLYFTSGIFAIISVHVTDSFRKTNAIKEALLLREQSKLINLQKQLETFEDHRTYQLKEQSIQLGFLSQEIQNLEQKERERMASLLHDHLQQHLAAARIQTQVARQAADQKTQNMAWDAIDESLANAIGVTRAVTASVAPNFPVQHGLKSSLHQLCSHLKNKFELQVDMSLGEKEAQESLIRSILYDCVRELLFNVVKHSGVRKAIVRLRFEKGEYWHLRVSDQGKGYSAGEDAMNASFGLQFLSRRIEKQEGTMEITSSDGTGFAVDVKLPCSSTRNKVPSTATDETSRPKLRWRGTKTRLLVADESNDFRKEIIQIFEGSSDIEIVGEGQNVQETMTLVMKNEPDILIVNMDISKNSGIEITKSVRRQTEMTRIIGFSNSDSARTAQRFIASGGDVFLLKSMLPSHLLHAVRTTKTARDWMIFRTNSQE